MGAMSNNRNALKLETQPRNILGKKVKRLRSDGITPINLYGPGVPSLSLQVDSVHLYEVVRSAGRTSPVSVVVDGSPEGVLSLVRDVGIHPTTGQILHVDFLRVNDNSIIEVPINITLVGDSPATVGGQAVVTQVLRTLYVRSTPFNAPEGIVADVSNLMHIGAVLRVSDLILPDDVENSGHPEDVVARVQRQREAEVFEDQAALVDESAEETDADAGEDVDGDVEEEKPESA